MYKIEKNVPMPEGWGRKKYPFADMAVGDCFLLAEEERKRLSSAADAYGKRHNMKFSIRGSGGEIRCWRVA